MVTFTEEILNGELHFFVPALQIYSDFILSEMKIQFIDKLHDVSQWPMF